MSLVAPEWIDEPVSTYYHARVGVRARTIDMLLAAGLAGFSLAIALWLTLRRAQTLIDDGFYYLKIAEHLARGVGSTFDGIHPTNGYHPLWAYALIPIFSVLPADESARAAASLLQGVLFACATAIFHTTARFFCARSAASVGALLWIMFAHRLSFSATEFALHALLLTVSAYIYLLWRGAGGRARGRPITLGVLLAITFLARTDTLLLGLILGSAVLLQARPQGSRNFWHLVHFGTPIILVVLLFAVLNHHFFGIPVPISGYVKRAWSDYYLAENTSVLSLGWISEKAMLAAAPLRALLTLRPGYSMVFPLYLTIATFGAAVCLVARITRPLPSRLGQKIERFAPFMLYSLANFGGYLFFFHDTMAYMPWYYVVQPWLAAIVLTLMLDALLQWMSSRSQAGSSRRMHVGIWLILTLGTTVFTARAIAFPTLLPPELRPRDPLQQSAEWLRENTPPNAVIAAWNAGIIGYYSQRRTINLDGLVNSLDFFEREQFDLCAYWQANHVSYITDFFDDQWARSPIPSFPYYEKCADQMELVWSTQVSDSARRVKIFRIGGQ